MLKKKDEYFSIYEDYLLTSGFAEHRYEAVSFCDLCHRLWNTDIYANTIRDFRKWFKDGKCYQPFEFYSSHT